LSDPQQTPLKKTSVDGEEPEEIRNKRNDLIKDLNSLYDKSAQKPFPFYGMLLMDGDRMGKLLRSDGKKVGKALAHFTKKVDGIVKSHDGILVYAGGDDVLAMLPRPRAIGCAHALSNEFELAFRKENIDATISPGWSLRVIVFHCAQSCKKLILS